MSAVEKRNILGVLIDDASLETATGIVIEAAHRGGAFALSAMAVHGVMEGVLDPAHLYRLNHLELVVADGQPVRWALNLIHSAGLGERVYGPNLTMDVLARAAHERIPVFFYGSTRDVLTVLCANVAVKFPELVIAGAEPSTFAKISPETADQVASKIKQSGAQIVFLGLGCPRQEVWAYEFRERLNMPIVAVGAAFPYLAGTLRQAPMWMKD